MPNALDRSSAHSIMWMHQLYVAGGASGSATMVAVFVLVLVCCGFASLVSSLYVENGTK